MGSWTNDEVAKAWKNGISRISGNGNFRTDGDSLYSYSMLIGRTNNTVKELLNVRSPYSFSRTTSQHVSIASYYCNNLIVPINWNNWRYFPDKAPRDYYIHEFRSKNREVYEQRVKAKQQSIYTINEFIKRFGAIEWYRKSKPIARIFRLLQLRSYYSSVNAIKEAESALDLACNLMNLHGIKVYARDANTKLEEIRIQLYSYD